MKSKYIYMILLMVGMLFSCQRPELSDPDAFLRPENGNAETVTLTFSALLPSSPATKAMGDKPFVGQGGDIKSMHLVIFDENGMLVETREAKIVKNDMDHDSDIVDKEGNNVPHLYETGFEVTLTVTDKPRIIHFIANCPLDQISYGNEVTVIGDMYVEKDNDPATPETAYWARIEVPYIKYNEVVVDGEKQNVPVDEIKAYFKCVPMLRNFAQVVVIDETGDDDLFEFEGFTVYNTIDIGTVAPYNNANQKFQSFLDTDGSKYSYPELTAMNYKGHALAAAELNTGFPQDAGGNVIFYNEYDPTDPDNPLNVFYMYERRISVKTDQEELWDESPPHVIVKGQYDKKTYFYKVDLVYDVIDDNGTPDLKTDDTVIDIEYYNILRNFRYQFTITAVAGKGFESLEEAVLGSTSNNLSGSSTTAKFTNISDTQGRLWVSYTDTTLVNNNQITLKYKYVPDLGDLDGNNDPVINNELADAGGHITLEDFVGGVIKAYEVADADIADGVWAGYREITLTINEPVNTTVDQVVTIRTKNVNLKRDVRYYLKQKFPLEIECTPKVAASINAPVELDIKLPVGLTDDMFPLDLAIEVYDMTLSPDASKNTLPVEVSSSVIPLPEKEGKPTFHYIKTIEKKSDYDALQTVGNRKVFTTYWLTNTADNESTIYVVNKYFNVASDNFINAKAFVAASINPAQIVYGIGKTAGISFTMDPNDANYNSRTMTVTLNGLTHPNAVTNADGTVTLSVQPSGNRVVTVNGFTTTTRDSEVSFTVEEDVYAPMTATATRRLGTFTPVSFTYKGQTVTNIPTAGGEDVTFNFNLSDWEEGMAVNVTLDGLESDDDRLRTPATRAVSYVYYPQAAGNHSINLKSTAGAKTCKVSLTADGFESVIDEELTQSDIQKYAGTLSVTVNKINIQHDRNNQNPTPTITIKSVTVNGADNISYDSKVSNITHTATQSGRKYTLTSASFDIENMLISGRSLTDDTTVTVLVTIKYGNNSKDYTVQYMLSNIN